MTTSSPSAPSNRRSHLAARLLDTLARTAWFVEDEVGGVGAVVPRGGVCVDVGAEYGLYTVAMAAAVGPLGTVHAFEPQPDAHGIMARATRIAGVRDRVVRHRCALAAEPGEGALSIPVRRGLPVHGRAFLTTGAAHGGPNDDEFARDRRVTVDVRTLDGMVAELGIEQLDLVKADVEGAELQVLRGGVEAIESLRPTVQLEIEQPHLDKYGVAVADVTSFLTDRGYGMHVWVEGGWRPTDRVTATRRNYLFTP